MFTLGDIIQRLQKMPFPEKGVKNFIMIFSDGDRVRVELEGSTYAVATDLLAVMKMVPVEVVAFVVGSYIQNMKGNNDGEENSKTDSGT